MTVAIPNPEPDRPEDSPVDEPKAPASLVLRRLMRDSFPVFMSQLRDSHGDSLEVAPHQRVWCDLLVALPRLVLLAPRDHGKTILLLAYALWQLFRHGTDAETGQPLGASRGRFLVILFTATQSQARILMSMFRELLAANAWLFPDAFERAHGIGPHVGASAERIRLESGAELQTRVFGTSTRGLHPDLLLLDDVLNELNSSTPEQRDKVSRYFSRVVLPMHATQIILVGTAIHASDLLHQLKPSKRHGPVHDFAWHRFRAINEKTGRALWPARHPYEELVRIRDFDPPACASEYQNRPTDEISTFFPYSLTQIAVDAGTEYTQVPYYHKRPGEYVVLGADIAISEQIGADYSVAMVVAYNRETKVRRVLAARRYLKRSFAEQVAIFTDLAVSYGVDVAYIEDNSFQSWLVDQLQAQPGGHVFYGHTTGRQRMSFDRAGIPMLKIPLLHGLWIMPSGDREAKAFARAWQDELAAFTWRNGRAQGVGAHDDIVIASWYVELAIVEVERLLVPREPEWEIVTMEDLFPGWEPYRIGHTEFG